MIERLRQFLSYEQGYEEDWSYAEDIVDFLISQGMLPPAYVDRFFTVPHSGCDAIFVEWVEESVNKWEPEAPE